MLLSNCRIARISTEFHVEIVRNGMIIFDGLLMKNGSWNLILYVLLSELGTYISDIFSRKMLLASLAKASLRSVKVCTYNPKESNYVFENPDHYNLHELKSHH